MIYFKDVKTMQELKKQYKKLAFENHPDRGGNAEIMKAINNEYEKMTILLKTQETKKGKQQEQQGEPSAEDIRRAKEQAREFIHIIDKIINLDGIIVEIMGDWVWLTGNTFRHKDFIKECGFYYASKKKAWYLKPADYVAKSRKNYSLDDIKNLYGCTTIADNTKGSKGKGKKPTLVLE